jgi:hypothetical protein
MEKPKIFVDFGNADSHGRIRLNCNGSIEDLSKQKVVLHDGLAITLYSDDLDDKGQLDELLVDGIASFSNEEHCWVARIDWTAIRHTSEGQSPQANSNSGTPPVRTVPERPDPSMSSKVKQEHLS